MKPFPSLMFCFVTIVPLIGANGQMTPEEKAVRTTYAKLVYATKIGAIHDVLAKNSQPSLAELEDRLAAKPLKFELSNFSSGSVNDIAKRVYADLVTKLNGEDELSVATGTHIHREGLEQKGEVIETKDAVAQASWTGGRKLTSESWNMPFEEALTHAQTDNKATYSRYASFAVTVSFQGRSRGYKAMFLFGSGDAPILALDNVTNNSALTGMARTSVYPAVLLESSMAQKPGIANWLKSHQVRDPACLPGQREVCCNPLALTCYVAEKDVSSALDKPISRIGSPSRGLAASYFAETTSNFPEPSS
jgi:hypothetical protein